MKLTPFAHPLKTLCLHRRTYSYIYVIYICYIYMLYIYVIYICIHLFIYSFISGCCCSVPPEFCHETFTPYSAALHWRHNEHYGVSNHQPHSCLLNRLFRQQIKENIKVPRHWPLCWEFTGTGEFPAQRASNAENVSIWWRHHGITSCLTGIRIEAFHNFDLGPILSTNTADSINCNCW